MAIPPLGGAPLGPDEDPSACFALMNGVEAAHFLRRVRGERFEAGAARALPHLGHGHGVARAGETVVAGEERCRNPGTDLVAIHLDGVNRLVERGAFPLQLRFPSLELTLFLRDPLLRLLRLRDDRLFLLEML